MPLDAQNEGIKLFGQAVRKHRKAKGYTMQHLANIAEIELSQVSRIETGLINPKLSTILILAKALEIQPGELFV
jgi:transcriptional regulator with XRE-family HTH domain